MQAPLLRSETVLAHTPSQADCFGQCDEKQPACGKCVRLDSRCSFLDSNTSNTPSLLGSTSAPAPNSKGVFFPSGETFTNPFFGSSLNGIHGPLYGLNGHIALKSVYVPTRLDLELLHHFTTITCFSLSNIPSKQQIWQVAVPREAMSHEFLLHALLAIAAVNLMYLDPAQRHLYERVAANHRNLALSTSISALNDVTPNNCHALFALSCVIPVLAFAFPHKEQLALPSTPVDDILNVFVLIRGVKTVLHSAQEWITRGALGGLIGYNWNSKMSPLPKDMSTSLQLLSEKNERDTPDASMRELYDSTIRGLKRAFEIHTVVRGESGLIFTWLVMAQASYIAQLEKKDPMALVILAHYAFLVYSSDGQWWIQGRGAQLFEAIYRILPPIWLSAVEWPRQAVSRDWNWTTDLVRAEPALSTSPNTDNGKSSKPRGKFKALPEE
ncbi:MAG: hypothetical protein ASARMPRED_000022 [Alectoria sarmentosa]|nr:MAG: hypothetical protein ASARMPRED_000022 [Alectoria sarmentosa]